MLRYRDEANIGDREKKELDGVLFIHGGANDTF